VGELGAMVCISLTLLMATQIEGCEYIIADGELFGGCFY
jgi:hypothetical protein